MTPSPNSGGKGEVEVVKTHSGDCHWWTYKVCDCGWLMRANSGDFGDPSDQVIKDFLTHSENCQHSLHLSDLLDRIKVLEGEVASKDAALHRCKCIFCGLEVPFEEKDRLADHIMSCEKSPVVQMAKEMESRVIDYMDLMNDEFARIAALSEDAEIVGICQRAMTVIAQKEPVIKQRDEALDRLKLSESEVGLLRESSSDLKSLLHRCLNTGLRDDKTRPLYLEVCRVLGVDPDKPWEEK